MAARWVAGEAAGRAGFAGAFLCGSAAWLPPEAELPAVSDVDIAVVVEGVPPPKPGKLDIDGVLLEPSYLPWDEVASPERVLGTYYLAGSLRGETVLADPTGRLGPVRAAVAEGFARRPWVERRCADAERRITGNLGGLDPAAPPHRQLMVWLFATGVTTHVLLTAGLRNPTVRLRYPAVRELLLAHGRPEWHEELLDLLGCARLSRDRVEHHLRAMTAAFDAAAAVARTPFHFSSDVSPRLRPTSVGSTRALIDQGAHREAVFWLAATYIRALAVLAADAPPAVTARHAAGLTELAADLGIPDTGDLRPRAARTLAFLPRLRGFAQELIRAHPAVRD